MIKIYKWFVNIVFVIVIAFLLIYLILRVTDKVEIYRVKTGSMEEKIHVGDYIMIYRKNNYNVGEIVTYTSNDGFITHRIIKKEGNRIITKGDANNTEDREIVASTIVGEAILVGGILNIVITYKYVIVCVLISLYLFSCYFGDGEKKEDSEKNDSNIEEENKEEDKKDDENKKEEITEESKKDDEIKENIEEKDENKEPEKVEEKLETKEEKNKEETNKVEETLIKKKMENKK